MQYHEMLENNIERIVHSKIVAAMMLPWIVLVVWIICSYMMDYSILLDHMIWDDYIYTMISNVHTDVVYYTYSALITP